MNTLTIQREQYDFRELRTYLAAALFLCGNIVVPQLCHLIPKGGLIFLPIYFFTLIGAFKCGWKVGLLTAVLSPLVNCLFFGMPPVASLPAILVKSITLAVAAGLIGKKMRFSLLSVALSVLICQVVGMTFEYLMDFNFLHALQDVRIGWPGILIQVFGGPGHDHPVSVVSHAGLRPPVSCLNDGLQISTGATLGHGLIRVAEIDAPCPEATFTCEGKTLTLSLKEQYRTQIETDIRTGVERYGHSPEYWAYVRSLALRYWSSWDRNEIFEVRSEKIIVPLSK